MKKNANDITNKATERQMRKVLLIVTTVIVVSMGAAFWAFSHAMKAETCVRYHGLQDMIASKMVKTLKSMETNAKNVFDEVGKHLDSPEAVIAALESKTSLAPDVRGYFAAFEPEYFPEKGRWFEPYVHQYADSSDFVLSMVCEGKGVANRLLVGSLFLLRRHWHQRSLLHICETGVRCRWETGLCLRCRYHL